MMFALAALLLAPAASAEAPLLGAFKAACARIDDFDAARADTARAGWEAVAEDSEPRIANLLKLGREAIGDAGKISGGTYRATFDERTVWLVLSRFEDTSGFWGNGCRAYDFDAKAPFPTADLDAWAGRPATGTEDKDGLVKRLWEPGWREGMSLEASFIPAGYPGVGNTGLTGRVLIAEAIGGYK